MKTTKKTPAKKTTKKADEQPTPQAVKHPTPEWMDPELAKVATQHDTLERIAMAEKFERWANELRGMQTVPVRATRMINFNARPKMVEAILYYANCHGAKEFKDEQDRVNAGARWVLETALQRIEQISSETNKEVKYCLAEGLEPTSYNEQRIAAALESWKQKRDGDKPNE